MKIIYLTFCVIMCLLVSMNVASAGKSLIKFGFRANFNCKFIILDYSSRPLRYTVPINARIRGGSNHRGRGGHFGGFVIGGRRQTQGSTRLRSYFTA